MIQERPLLSVSLPLGHPAVDSSGRLRFRSLDEWGVPGSEQQSLQALVREAIFMLASASPQTGPGKDAMSACGVSKIQNCVHCVVVSEREKPFTQGPSFTCASDAVF